MYRQISSFVMHSILANKIHFCAYLLQECAKVLLSRKIHKWRRRYNQEID